MHIQNFGLLADIKKRVYAKGDAVVTWSELEAFAAQIKMKDLPAALETWANENMMWVQFEYDESPPWSERKITSVIFGASK